MNQHHPHLGVDQLVPKTDRTLTATHAWKPAGKIKLEHNPNSIASRTRLRNNQDAALNIAAPNDNLNIGAVCSPKTEQERAQPSSGIQEDWELCHGR